METLTTQRSPEAAERPRQPAERPRRQVERPREQLERGSQLRRADIIRTGDGRRTASGGAVLRAALDHGPVARSTIARLTGLSAAAVSRHCAELAERGLLREVPEPAGSRAVGRPHVPVDVDVDRHLVWALHIAVPYAVLALVDLRGRVVASERIPHAGHGGADPARTLARVAARLPAFAAEHAGGRAPLGLGVATGGWVDPDAGVIVEHAPLGWRDVPVRRLLADATGLPVRVEEHARALIRAEQLFGDARTRSSAVHLFVGNVVDAAFATGGVVHHGPRSAAGAIAHLPLPGRDDPCECGQAGCLQAVVSEGAMAARAADLGVIAAPSFPGLVAAARAGTPAAVGLLRERARLIGTAAALLLDILNPEVMVVAEAGVIHLPECLADLRAAIRLPGTRSRRRGAERAVVATSFGADVLAVAAGGAVLDAVYSGEPALDINFRSCNVDSRRPSADAYSMHACR